MSATLSWLVGKLADPFGGRERLNDSVAYRTYLSLRYPAYARLIRAEQNFYRELLRSVGSKLVFDIGAHCGNKAVMFASIADRVVCVEPAPESAALLRRRFAGNHKVIIEEKGVSSQAGSAMFHFFSQETGVSTFSLKWANHIAESGNVAESVVVPVTTLRDLIAVHGLPNYIKIAAEGLESEILKGLDKPIPLINFEANLPAFRAETLEVINHITKVMPDAKFNFCITESPTAFHESYWLTSEEICGIVHASKFNFMEIYSRLPS